jgi:hypothetical protein
MAPNITATCLALTHCKQLLISSYVKALLHLVLPLLLALLLLLQTN